MKLPRFRARTLAGGGIFLLTAMVFAMIFLKPELAKDDLFKMLAQAVVVQGLVGLAMAFWFTAKEREHHAGPIEMASEEQEARDASDNLG